MIGNISQLEDLINLDSIGLFLNSFDVTNAFMDIYSSNELFKFAKNLSLKRPYKDYSVKNYKQLNNSRKMAFRGKELVNKEILSIIKTESDLNDLFLQSLIDYLVSKPLIMQSNPKYNPDSIENQDHIVKYIDRPSTKPMLYRSLNSFYRKASVKFEKFNEYLYEDFIDDLSNGLLGEVQEQKNAFGLYLLSHTDIRINFLSQFFISRNPSEILDSFPMIEVRETYHNFSDYDEIIRYISERVDNGNQLLQIMDLRRENNFQPKDGGLIQKSILGYKSLENKIDQINTEKEKAIEDFEKKREEFKEVCTSKIVKEKELHKRIKELEEKIFCMKNEKSKIPEVKTTKDYQSLKKHNNYLSSKLKENNHKLRSLKKSKKNTNIKTQELEKKLKNLEGKISGLNNTITELSIIPNLKEFYNDKRVLVVVGLPKQMEVYKRESEKIFNDYKLILYDKALQQKAGDYDLVLVITGLVSHGDRWNLEKKYGKKKVMIYPSKPNQLLRTLNSYIRQ